MDSGNSSTARILMKAGGETGKVTGLTLSTASTMYIMKYLLTAGCATIEYLPHIFNPESTVGVADHYSSHMNSSWRAVFLTGVVLLGGVVVRKMGTVLSDEGSIERMERFLYRTGNDKKG